MPRWLFVTLSRKVMELLIDLNFGRVSNNIPVVSDDEITDLDQEVVQYIAGFVLHRQRKKFMRLQESQNKTDYLAIIEGVLDEDNTPARLISTKQRGGLLYPSRTLVSFFVRVELIVRQFLVVNEVIHSLSANTVMKVIYEDDQCSDLYESSVASVSVPTDLKETFLNDITSTYIKTRASGYCRQQVQRLKQLKKTAKRERSLRTSLK